MAEINPCPRCGALPCDWVDDPHMREDVAQALRREFGYVPDEADYDKWIVYEDTLIVINPRRRPRLFRKGCAGNYYEIEPQP